jgi:hypothetical protein
VKDPLARRESDPSELEIYGPNGNDGLAVRCRHPEREGKHSIGHRDITVHSLIILKKDFREYRG